MKSTQWFERKFQFGLKPGMLPFFIERLSFTSMRMEQKVRGVADLILSTQMDGKWSVKQNIGHLAEVDEIAMKRIQEMLNGIQQLSPAVFEPKQNYNDQPVEEVINYFKKNREDNIALYNSLSEVDLQKESLHPRLKVMMNPVDLAMFDAEHDDHHLVKINEILTEFAN
ncbi:MAG: DinB family protein [Cyclobacteriaceae bacterium]